MEFQVKTIQNEHDEQTAYHFSPVSSNSEHKYQRSYTVLKNTDGDEQFGLLHLRERIFVKEFGRDLDTAWGGHWFTYCRHTDFEAGTRVNNLVWMQHGYTDPFFRNLQYVLNQGFMHESDIRSKVGMVMNPNDDPNECKKAVDFLSTFVHIEQAANLKQFAQFALDESNTYAMAMLVRTAHAILALANGDRDDAYEKWNNLAEEIKEEMEGVEIKTLSRVGVGVVVVGGVLGYRV
jgi:hypothetical protein